MVVFKNNNNINCNCNKNINIKTCGQTIIMKLLTYKTQISESRLGFIHNNQVVDMEDFGDISNFPLPDSMLELIDMGIEVIEEINSLVEDANPAELAEISYSFD